VFRVQAYGLRGAIVPGLALMALAAGLAPEVQAKSERVATDFNYPAGSVVIVNAERKIYYVTAKGEAIRYPVAVGKQSELWMGRTFVAAKQVDPKWIPVNGDDPVEGGDPANPLGKRAMYLDWSLLRIHGTPSRGSIGSAVSNGCIRMLNEDVVDLFDRVHLGAPVYAVSSRKDASRFEANKIAEKIYANPAAREAAKAEEQAQRDEDEQDRRAAARERATERRYVSQSPVSQPVRSAQRAPQSSPAAWPVRSGLGFNSER
jgi:L,D-transpeptidase catalytic domain